VALLSALVVGPFLSTLTFREYYTNPQSWKYLLNGLLLPVHELPGVFSQSVYDPTVNGPLWTLPVEFFCYILCFLVYKLKLLTPKRFPLVLAAGIIGAAGSILLLKNTGTLLNAVRPILLFLIGMGFYVYRDHIRLNPFVALGATILSALLFWCGRGT
jgi:peptidoglycan/LPS O-acetylase OafA/YrhL